MYDSTVTKPAELVDGTYHRHFITARHRHYEVRRHRAVILWVLVTAKVHDPLDTDAKGLQLLSDDVLVHWAAEILYKKAGAAFFWE